MAKTDFKSVGAYIGSKPKNVQAALKLVRAAIRKAVPRAKEGISYQIPAYKMDGMPVLYFAGWKKSSAQSPATTLFPCSRTQEHKVSTRDCSQFAVITAAVVKRIATSV